MFSHLSSSNGGWVGTYVTWGWMDGWVLMYYVALADRWVLICRVAGWMFRVSYDRGGWVGPYY